MIRERKFTEQKKQYKILVSAYRHSAQLVKLYGSTYLPIFERLHREMENAKHIQALTQVALNLAE